MWASEEGVAGSREAQLTLGILKATIELWVHFCAGGKTWERVQITKEFGKVEKTIEGNQHVSAL